MDGGWMPLPTRPQRYCDPCHLFFLVADTQLYKRLCPSVGPSVRRSVGRSVGRYLLLTRRISTIRLFQRWRRSVMIKRALIEVYTALLLPLPKSTRLMLSCIRPCFYLGSENQRDEEMCAQRKQGHKHGIISRVLLGRGSNKAVTTSMGACCIITDCFQR